ncbi:conserved hypothetical protein [Cupriavidus taiwanensis]|nr:conserved hypothetical protein [Cupriavidus taiwanensis]SOZ81467.1 conserved hypothetical protein [Cupriavidus taiwanensis]SOZ82701.1 conserved hypothetical protein [Cupriavidus taiwanensis]SPA16214.1 conserved hypothetical protein [Cupriavidus taiwanensis]
MPRMEARGVRKRSAKVYAAPYKERENRGRAGSRCTAQCKGNRCSIMGRTPPRCAGCGQGASRCPAERSAR